MVTERCISEQLNKFLISMFTKEDSNRGNVSLADWIYKGPMEEVYVALK